MGRPKAWKKYVSHIKLTGETPDQMLVNFSARYAFASALEDFVLPDFSEATRHGYLVATKLAYAYSALEALERAIGVHSVKARSQIIDFHFASRLANGDFSAALDQIIDAAEKQRVDRVRVGLEDMMENLDSGNVRPFVEGIRNSLFHGKFTPTASGIRSSKSRRESLLSLAQEILISADEVFSDWLSAELSRGQDSP
jgi:hypothetical protein